MTHLKSLLLASVASAFEGSPITPAAAAMIREAHARDANSAANMDAMLVRSRDSAAMLDYWNKTDAIVDGIDALRMAGDAYLPRFAHEGDPEYQQRKKLTMLTNIYRDVVEGLAAKPFEQDVTLKEDEASASVPAEMKTFIEDVDGAGNHLSVFASATFFNGINSAIDWIYVDHPPADPKIRNEADRKASGVRPYWSHVLGRNVFEARSRVIGGNETLVYIRIFEPGAPDHVRVFEMADGGAITWQLWKKTDKWHNLPGELNARTMFVIDQEGTLSIDAIPLVPFYTGRRDGRTFKFWPAMKDAADLQIELYQEESGLKFAKRLTAYPMLTGNGVKPPVDAEGNPTAIAVGPNRVLYAPPYADGKHGEWTYIEPSAQSLTFLAASIKDMKADLRELGRQPLVATMGITVIQAGMAASKAKSAVKAWALQLKDTLEKALILTAKFRNDRTWKPTVNVFVEFDEFLDGKDLESLDADRDRGDISQETLWTEKKRRGVYSPEFDPDQERERLLKEVPADGAEDTDDEDAPGAPRKRPTKPKGTPTK